MKQAFEIKLLKVLKQRTERVEFPLSLFHSLLVTNLFREHAEINASSHLELSSENFISPVE
jgi:hypothetical protein